MNEAKKLTIEEVKALKEGEQVYIEHFFGFGNNIASELEPAYRHDWEDTDNDFWVGFSTRNYAQFNYGFQWRAWSGEPTKEQRLPFMLSLA